VWCGTERNKKFNSKYATSADYWRRRLNGTMKPAIIRYRAKTAYGAKVWRFRRLPEIAAGLELAVGYCRVAERDEKNGYPFTAAMEWHKAAEMFSPITEVSDQCWQQWERIMHLPRRFACPIVDSAEVRPHDSRTCDGHEITKAVVNEVPSPVATERRDVIGEAGL
jgi:hypothetical protein